MLPTGPAVQLVQPQLLSAHIVPGPRLVLHVDAEVHVLLGCQHLARENGISGLPGKDQGPCTQQPRSHKMVRARSLLALGPLRSTPALLPSRCTDEATRLREKHVA